MNQIIVMPARVPCKTGLTIHREEEKPLPQIRLPTGCGKNPEGNYCTAEQVRNVGGEEGKP